MVTQKEIFDEIATVIDPEVGYNLVELGLIYGADISKDGKNVIITMTLSTKGCPLHQMLVEWVKAAVLRCEGVGECEVNIVWEPVWTIDRAEPHVKAALGSW